MFGRYHYDDVLDLTHVCVPPPFENNAFAAVCAKFMLKHLPRDVDVPDLDSDNHMVVLDKGGNILDFRSGRLGAVLRTTACTVAAPSSSRTSRCRCGSRSSA